ncbi:MAG: OmpA family protein [Bdellovibrionales bacterium]|nr:OmpA family protein [Oligoflexia bacterium]
MKKLLVLMLASTLAMSACSKKTQTDESSGSAIPTAANADENTMGDSDSGKAMGLQTIHFGYDAYTLDSGAKSTLKSNAQILKDKGSIKIQVEGHCDQRGGIQYNIALGEKRANSVKKFIQEQGIPAERVTVISFGKEKPADPSETEEAYTKNRRANFVITTR